MWNSVFCEGKKVLKIESLAFWKWKWDYKVNPPKQFLEDTLPPYVVVPTNTKGLVLLYAQSKVSEPKTE